MRCKPFLHLHCRCQIVGRFKQIGDIDTKQIQSIACVATDRAGQTYELQFLAGGEPATVQKITREPLESVRRRARLRALKACRIKAADAQILPRDKAAYIIRPAPGTG